MKKYNIMRPIMLIVIALLTKSLVTNLCMLLGMEAESAKSLGFGAMVIAALLVFSRSRRRPK